MAGRRKLGLLVLICTVALVFVILALSGSAPDSDVCIEYRGNSNFLFRSVAILRLSNNGGTTVRLDPYCTLYWTNQVGLETNEFFRHDQGYLILKPHESTEIPVPHPPTAEFWDTSFTYQVRPNAIKALYA